MKWSYRCDYHANYIAGPKKLRHNYWEVNLMCHVLNRFTNYGEMYGLPVHEAMHQLIEQVDLIDDESVGKLHRELHSETKERVKGLLQELSDGFKGDLEGVLMKHLYTLEGNPDIGQDLIDKFEALQTEVFKDTQDQKDPREADGKRFGQGCEPCLPFLRVLKDPSQAIDVDVMEDHIDKVGQYTLQQLYEMAKCNLSDDVNDAIQYAKKNGIFSAKRRSGDSKVLEFKNDLVCSETSNQCVADPDSFCVEDDEGSCSAMSDDPEP